MPKKSFEVKKINDNIYSLEEFHSACAFLVIGEEKACLIDTMYGHCYTMEDIRKITTKPLIVINTHSHGDHVLGNIHFDKAYIHPTDLEDAKLSLKNGYRSFPGRLFKKLKYSEFEPIKEGDTISLGGLDLKICDLPGHTPGEIVVLCPQLRIVFSGDAINHHLYAWLKGCLPLKEMADALKRLMFLTNEADYILHGHSKDLNDISLLPCLINGIEEIVEGKTENDVVVRIMGKKVRRHEFKVLPDGKYNSDEHFVFYPYQ